MGSEERMTEKQLIKDLEENVCCRIKPSPVHGVGVFAIRDIPKGTDPFGGLRNTRWKKIPLHRIRANRKIPHAVKELVESFYAVESGMLYFPNHSLNAVDISFFLNHSDPPNIGALAGGTDFVALRDIKRGEELFSDHRTYSDT